MPVLRSIHAPVHSYYSECPVANDCHITGYASDGLAAVLRPLWAHDRGELGLQVMPEDVPVKVCWIDRLFVAVDKGG